MNDVTARDWQSRHQQTLSAGITLYPGDLIATGTPVGVGIGFTPPKYLQPGDLVRIEIDGIGALESPVR